MTVIGDKAMPTKMTRVTDQGKMKESQLFYIILPKMPAQNEGPSEPAVDALYKLWKSSPPGVKSLSASSLEPRLIRDLREHDCVQGSGEAIELTDRGRRIISEMVTREENAFKRNAGEVTYRKVKAAKAAITRPKHLGKKASKEPTKPYNLRKESIRKMSE